ncbi:MAG: 50S ribosomal protein L22 [Candidatus Korarchaeota archaeon]
MPTIKYTINEELLHEDTAKARGLDLPISPRAAVEVCRAIIGKKIPEAKKLLQDIISLKTPIPFRRHYKKRGHKSQLTGWPAGGYPTKAARFILKILENLENNAEQKELDPEQMVIIHASTKKGFTRKKYLPRAFGRATPYFGTTVHCEIVAEQRLEGGEI